MHAAPAPPPSAIPPLLRNRANGELRASFARVGSRTVPLKFYEAGGLRLRFPKGPPGLEPGCEAVTINTGGGLAGGDRSALAFEAGPDSAVTITTQSAEKVYRAAGGLTAVEVRLAAASGSRLEWLPQETILFDEARLTRSLQADVASSASLLMVESVVFGRLARGETVRNGLFRDSWRVRRDGRLIVAEAVALEGPVAALLDRAALGGGARCLATLLLVSPHAEGLLEPVRAALGTEVPVGAASAWNGLLVARLLAPSPAPVRAAIIRVLEALRGRAAPRVWQ